MEFEVFYSLDNEQQFWEELEDILSTNCHSHELIDNALRRYLSFATNFKEEYLPTDHDLARCTSRLLQSPLFTKHKEYVRRQLVYCLLQDDDPAWLHLIAAFHLYDGRNEEETFEMMRAEGAFPRIVELLQTRRIQEHDGLHRMLYELLYEMSRIQRLSWGDLMAVDDAFVLSLFQIVEQLSNDVHDPYLYPVIRVLLVFNEQYMVASTTQSPRYRPLTNRILKALSTHGHLYKTFGESLILLLNRESETSSQLLILKLLYLMFQSPNTAEYFYTNDLHVLVDVIIRNLLDLPADSAPADALRHTYLRVLHPLLANSQIARPPHYKRYEVLKMLDILSNANCGVSQHFAPVDDTTIRLVKRCASVPWLQDVEPESPAIEITSDVDDRSPTSVSAGEGQKELARRMLGMSVKEANESAASVIEVASHTEKPGVMAPSKESLKFLGFNGGS